jgi:uncharacterized protein (TIGR02453 family)
MSTFQGFSRDGIDFLVELAANNDRAWFQPRKDDYERLLKRPMEDLCVALAEVFAARGIPLVADPARSPFRIYRDVRFSKDKSPYKTHIGGYVAVAGSTPGPSGIAAPYVHVGADEVFVGAGQYMMDPVQLTRFRAAVVDDERGAAVGAILKKLERAGFEVGSYDALQRVPRGFDPEHPRAALLKRKGLIVSYPDLPRKLLVEPGLVDWIVTQTKRVVPLVEWLASVGE